MQVRLVFFADKLRRTKNLFEKIQLNDDKMRSLLAMNSRKSIIEGSLVENFGEGGPTPAQENAFAAILSGNVSKTDLSVISKNASLINEQFQFMQKSYSEIMSHIRQQRLLYMATPAGWPCEGTITSPYGFRFNPFFQNRDFHSGIDIANARNTPIYSTANGRVIFSGWQSGYGNIVVIDNGYNYMTEYGHLEKRLVQTGTYVTRGQLIAKMGSSGSATGTHVHYEIHYKNKTVNPATYLTDHFYDRYERSAYDQKKFKKSA
ncbi:MAG: M23 family metallopeptidase [Endomicrobia bacterium]|nr:M23 family metallopeptidase [Endomicrobiia bacterium]